jgi:hypothetical protein
VLTSLVKVDSVKHVLDASQNAMVLKTMFAGKSRRKTVETTIEE